MKGEKRIDVLFVESENRDAILDFLKNTSGNLAGHGHVNILNYEVDDTLLRVVLASLREGAALS